MQDFICLHEDLSVQNLSAQIVQAKARRCIRRWASKSNQTKETLKPQDKAIPKRAMTSAPFPRCLNVLALPKPPAFGLCCLIGLVVCLALLRHELLHKLKVRPSHALFDHTQANIFAPEKNGTDIAPVDVPIGGHHFDATVTNEPMQTFARNSARGLFGLRRIDPQQTQLDAPSVPCAYPNRVPVTNVGHVSVEAPGKLLWTKEKA